MITRDKFFNLNSLR